MPKISQLEAATDITASDLMQVVDIEDTGMAPSGTNKKATAQLVANNLAKIINDGAVITANTSTDAVRITQTGSGNALVVEDSTNPDGTAFVVTNDGNVRIGTSTSSARKVDVVGETLTLSSSSTYALGVANVGGGNADVTIGSDSSYGYVQSWGKPLYLNSQGNNVVFGSGNVGIGTNSPTAKLNVVDDTSNDAVRITQTGSGNALVVEDSTNPDSTPTVITASGNVGIGTNNPSAKLEVSGVVPAGEIISKVTNFSSTSGSQARLDMATGTANAYSILAVNESATPYGELSHGPGITGGMFFRSGTTSAPIVFNQSSSERMRISSNGNVGIGTSSPSYQLELSTDSAAKPSTSTWTISSDERLKENIEAADLDICYNAVKNIPLKRYKWKDEIYSAEQVADRSKIGWIAQDVQAVFPKAVNEHKFVYNQVKDEDGNIVSEDVIEDCLSLNSDQIYAALFGAVQKLMGEVELLQGRVAELEAAP